MRISIQLPIQFIALLFNMGICSAQDNSLTKEYKKEVVMISLEIMKLLLHVALTISCFKIGKSLI